MADHKLKCVKQTRKQMEANEEVEKDFFPVSLHVSDESVEALGLGGAKIGDERMVLARARVTHISAHESPEHTHKSVGLDFLEGTTHEPPSSTSQEQRAETLFGKDE